MVTVNTISKHGEFEPISSRRRPRKFTFDVGDYDVAVRKKSTRRSHFVHTQIWHAKRSVGYIDLVTVFDDVKSILSVSTGIDPEYQGLGIAHRVYEGIVNYTNIGIISDNQSKGAIKLWRKFASDPDVKLYYVDETYGRLFDSMVYDVALNAKGHLEAFRSDGTSFDPYKTYGALLLIGAKSELNKTIRKHISLRKQISEIATEFQPFDEIRC